MKILGLKLSTWIKHPLLAWEAYGRRNLPVVDLDHPEYNCRWCGIDHHSNERPNTGVSSLNDEGVQP